MDATFKKTQQIRKVSGQIIYICDSYLKVKILDSYKYGYCLIENLTDFNREDINYFFKNPEQVFSFLVLKETNNKFYLSYKAVHPEEILLKSKPVNTNSYYKNLQTHLLKEIEKYSFD